MDNNLKILITGTLNAGATIGEINAALKGIEKKINKLKLKVEVNDNVLNTLKNFAKQMEKVSVASLKTGNVIQTSTNKANQNLQGQIKTLKQLSQGYERVNVQVKKYADGSTKSITSTLKDDKGNGRVVTQDGSGQVTGYKDIKNIEKFQIEQDKLRKSLIELARTGKYTNDELRKIGKGIALSTTLKELTSLQSKMTNMKLGSSLNSQTESIRQSLKKMYDQGLVNENFFRNFNKVINSAKNVGELNKLSQALNRVNDAGVNKNKQQNLMSQAETLLGGKSKKLDTTGVNNLITQLKNLKPNATSAANELKRIEQQLKQYQAQAKVAGAHTLTFGSALKQALAGFSLWSLTAQMVYAPIRALQDMTQRLIEIDTLMTDLRRVMDMPDFKFTQLLNDAVQTSDELSSKLNDVLKIMGDFGRMGFGEGQLVDITKTAQVLQNISDLDATSAVDTLTSAMLNFNIAADDSISIADKLNEVDNNFAISTKDLSDGIRKAAASAKTFGVDINELTGYIAAIGSTTRESGSIIGNGLKTIFSRMTTMNDAIGALQNVGVSIRDMAGNVRPVSDIMGDLAGKWSNLTDEQRQNTAVSVAGRYQLTRFLALMNNFSIAQSATTTAINSSGSAMKEQNKYADSLEARINRLDTAWNKFTLSVGNAVLTDGIIGGVESLNDLATGVAKLVDKFGLLSGVFGIIGIATVGLSTKFRTFTTSMIFGTSQMTRMQLASVGLTAGMGRLGIATLGVKTAFRGLVASTGVGLLFVGIGFALEKLIGYYSDAKQAQEDFEQQQQKSVDALTKNKQETEHLIEQYNGLTEAKKKLGENWSTKQEDQYLQIQQRLADLYPQLIGYIDGAGHAHLKSKDAIDQELASTNKLIDAKKLQQQVDAKKDISDAMNKRNDIQKNIERTQTELDNPTKIIGYGEGQTVVKKTENDLKSLQSQLLIYQNQWSSAAQLVTSKVLTIAEAYTKLQIDPSISQSVTNFFSSIDTSKLDADQLEGFAVQIAMAQDAMQKAYASSDSTAFDKAKQQIQSIGDQMGATSQKVFSFALSYDGLKKAAEQGATAVFAGKDGMDGLDESVSDLDGNVSGLSGSTDGLAGSFSGLEGAANGASGALDGNINAAQILFGVTSDQIAIIENAIAVFQALSGQANLTAQQQGLLAQATNILAAQYPQLNGQIAENIGWISSQAGMMASLSDVSGEHTATMIQNQNATTKATIAQINQRITGYQKEAAALDGLIRRIEASYELEGMSGAKSYAYNHATTRLGELNASMASAQASKVEAYYGSGVKTGQVKPYNGSSSGGGSGSKGGSGGSKSSSEGKSAFEKYLDQTDARIAESEARAEALERTSKAYQNEINTQWALQTDKAKKYQAEIARLTKTQGANGEEVLKLRESYAGLQKEIADLNWEYYDAEIQRYSDKVADLSDEIEYSKKVMELHSDSFAINQIETEKQIALYEDQIKLLDQERATMERAIKNGYLNAAQKKEMQERLDALNKEYIDYEINIKNATDALEAQRQAEKDQMKQKADDFIDAYKAYYEKRKELDQKALDDELSAYEKMVNEKIALIDKEEQARDDSRELANKQKEISDIQAQINALSGDSSQAGKVSELRKQLAEKQLDLGEYVHDKEVEQRKDALNSELEQKRSQIEEEKKLMDEHYENLLNDERKFAEMREQIMNGNVLYFQSMLALFTQDVQNNMGEIGKSISENLIDKLAEASDGLSDAKQEFDNMSKVYSGSDMNVSGTDTAKEDKVTIQEDTPLLKKTANGYEYSGTTLKKGSTYKAYGVNNKDGVYLVGGNGYVTADPKFTKYQRFNTGGFTGNSEGFAWLDKKELIFKEKDSINMLKALDITRQIASMLPKFTIPKIIPNNVANQHQTINMNINIEHMNGTKQGVNDFFKDINNALRSKGGMLFT